MRKRKSNLNLVTRGVLVWFALLTLILPGCKKETPSPPSKAMPLPKKSVQKNVSTAKQTPVKPDDQTAKQQQGKLVTAASKQTSVKPGATTSLQAGGKPEVQQQVSSARLLPSQTAINLDFTNRRDPFKPFIQAPAPSPGTGGPSKFIKDALPIQNFDTEKFRVTGIITGIRENSALVLDPAGKGYVVKAGMLIGSNNGRIKRITDTSVEVEESFRDDHGRVKKRIVKLTLIRKK